MASCVSVCAPSRIARSIVRYFTLLHRQIVRSPRIAGCTDSHASRGAALTALSLDPERIGIEAVESLIAVTENRTDRPAHCYVPTTVIPRASTKG